MEETTPVPAAPPRRRRSWIWYFVQAAFVALAIRLLIPQLSQLEDTSRQVLIGFPIMGVLVILLELGALFAYAELVRNNLATMGEDAPRGLMRLSALAGNALGRILPGGTSTALAVQVESLGQAGIDRPTLIAALAASGVVSSLVLTLLFPVAALLSFLGGHVGSIALGAAGIALVILVAAIAARPALHRSAAVGGMVERIARRCGVGPLRKRIAPAAIGAHVSRFLDNLADLVADRGALALGGGWAAANWLLDFAVLLVMAMTVGYGTPLWSLLLAYIVAQLTMALPITPGGIGTVEVAMTTALVATGAPAAAATSTVLGWRLVSQWLPILWGLPLVPVLRRSAAKRGRRVGAAPPAQEDPHEEAHPGEDSPGEGR